MNHEEEHYQMSITVILYESFIYLFRRINSYELFSSFTIDCSFKGDSAMKRSLSICESTNDEIKKFPREFDCREEK